MLKVVVGYPSFHGEVVVVRRVTGPPIELGQVVTIERLLEMQRAAAAVYVDPTVVAYAATLATATRQAATMGLPEFASAIAYGASPRASINMVAAARALALIRGRAHGPPHDVDDVSPEALR